MCFLTICKISYYSPNFMFYILCDCWQALYLQVFEVFELPHKKNKFPLGNAWSQLHISYLKIFNHNLH